MRFVGGARQGPAVLSRLRFVTEEWPDVTSTTVIRKRRAMPSLARPLVSLSPPTARDPDRNFPKEQVTRC